MIKNINTNFDFLLIRNIALLFNCIVVPYTKTEYINDEDFEGFCDIDYISISSTHLPTLDNCLISLKSRFDLFNINFTSVCGFYSYTFEFCC